MRGNETVTILRDSPGGTDVYGDPIPSTTARIDVPGCLVAPRISVEPTARGSEGVVTGWEVIAPTGTDARYTDRIEVPYMGAVVTCNIVGEIADWPPEGSIINASRAVG